MRHNVIVVHSVEAPTLADAENAVKGFLDHEWNQRQIPSAPEMRPKGTVMMHVSSSNVVNEVGQRVFCFE